MRCVIKVFFHHHPNFKWFVSLSESMSEIVYLTNVNNSSKMMFGALYFL